MYRIFLSFDLAADCLFAHILCNAQQRDYEQIWRSWRKQALNGEEEVVNMEKKRLEALQALREHTVNELNTI